ncbi:MAG TPA: hypothetical protein VJK51_00760 [Candidatus Nanoarchaeia archaeon]|nr:hypothetical protein [Candidatus Nanoarchaeia archaeon]
MEKTCEHHWQFKAPIEIDELWFDLFYCTRCLSYIKKERPCPKTQIPTTK